MVWTILRASELALQDFSPRKLLLLWIFLSVR